MATFWPSTKPASFSPSRNAATSGANASGEALCRCPIIGIAGCCARAASGHAAALPSSVMNSRRCMPNMGLAPPHPVRRVSRTLSLARRDWLVLGATLNRSESRCWPALTSEIGRQCRQAIDLVLGPAEPDGDILALDEAGFLQPIAECRDKRRQRIR